ncbi:MAG: hypothetical protein AAGM36_17425 [Cyanobacteria bacterium J06597_1]
MERYVTGVGRKALSVSQGVAMRVRDSASRIGGLAVNSGDRYISKARILLADTIAIAKESLGNRS